LYEQSLEGIEGTHTAWVVCKARPIWRADGNAGLDCVGCVESHQEEGKKSVIDFIKFFFGDGWMDGLLFRMNLYQVPGSGTKKCDPSALMIRRVGCR
jgi:hypothetical protein